ncbi:hypothetical protein EDF66_105304 [Sphingobacterium sp. JUb20]|nr:hypothetical protein [Sphingobacterium sp. JUb21]TCR07671.1 hypothetical protein EDF66_105304 [Sphingobacterium sp. JUb20]
MYMLYYHKEPLNYKPSNRYHYYDRVEIEKIFITAFIFTDHYGTYPRYMFI